MSEGRPWHVEPATESMSDDDLARIEKDLWYSDGSNPDLDDHRALVAEIKRVRSDGRYQAGYRHGADNEWASIDAVADEFGDDELLAYIKRRLVADGWVSE